MERPDDQLVNPKGLPLGASVPAEESSSSAPYPDAPGMPGTDGSTYLWVGRRAWATVGIVAVVVIIGYVFDQLSLVVIPVLLALFPAALLLPLAQQLKRIGLPASVAALSTMVILLGAIGAIFAGMTMMVSAELPQLQASLSEGIVDLERMIEDDPLGIGYDFPGFGVLLETARQGLMGDNGAGVAGSALGAATTVTEGMTGLLLLLVALFFYLKDEGRLAAGVVGTLPQTWQKHATELAGRFWTTVGRYIRGQLFVALVDAVFIGLGLVLLGIPLALPLAVLVFFGGLFPIVGAVVTGFVAVLVALADAGVVRAVMVLVLILVVQQVESNVLEPLILSNVIALHPLAIILSLTAGSVLLGILGAFLAVPVAAGVARSLDYARAEMGRASLVLSEQRRFSA